MKPFRSAVLKARANPVAFVAAATGIVALAIVVLTGIGYLFSPIPPYGFYYDLGVDVLATSTIAHWLAHAVDVKDALGWAGWGDRSAFAFAPMTGVAISVLFAKLLGDAMQAVKAVQVLQVLLAAASAFALYRTLRPGSAWAWVAGAVYALAAEQLLMIRGDLSFGFSAALAPLAFAVPLWLVPRYRLAALPICGVLLASLSAYFTIEHLFLQGIPAYAFAVALAYDRRDRLRWTLASAGGFVLLFASTAFVVLPTQASLTLFSPSSTVGAALAGGEFAQYQNGPLAVAALTMNELISNPRKAFALGPLVALIAPVGVALWALAITWVARAVRKRTMSRGELTLAITSLACIVLSTGALIPGVGTIWWIVAQVPVLDNIRTPDRLIALGVVGVVTFAVAGLEAMSLRPRGAAAAWLSATLCALGLAAFFLFRTFLGDTIRLDIAEPSLAATSQIAQARGNRVSSFALVRKGSIFDTPLYGSPMPFLDFQNDFAERYEGDGLGGSGLLARGNVATILASPPWSPDSPLYGQSAIARSQFLRPLSGNAMTVTAYGVDPPRGYVNGVTLTCLSGGPGLLDHLVAMPAFSQVAFTTSGSSCRRTLYVDSAPLAASLGGEPVYRWSALSLFPHAGVMRDIDYRITFGRFLINDPWYRNAIDGDSPLLSPAALSLDPGFESSSVFEIDQPGRYTFAMRVVCHGAARGRIIVDRRQAAFLCRAQRGFQWLGVPIGALARGLHGVTLIFDTIEEPAGALQSTWRLAFDGAAIVRAAATTAQTVPSAYVFSTSRLSQISVAERAYGSLTLARADGMQTVASASGSGSALLATSSNATATYRWSGAPGTYRISATAYGESTNSTTTSVTIAGPDGCCAGVATIPSGRGSITIANGTVSLKDGSLVRVSARLDPGDPGALVELLGVTAEPDPLPAVLSDDRTRAFVDIDFLARLHNLAPSVSSQPAEYVEEGEIARFGGLPVSSPLRVDVVFPDVASRRPTALHVDADSAGGPLHAVLRCGDASAEGSFTSTGGDVAIGPATSNDCRVTLSSTWGTLYLRGVTVSRPVGSYDAAGTRWLGSGRYRVIRVGRGGESVGGAVRVDGRPAGDEVTIARDGLHELRWNAAPDDAYLLAFVPVQWAHGSAKIETAEAAAARWRVTVPRAQTLEAAVFPDGFWRLNGNGRSLSGSRCDLENTCFDRVPPGTYLLVHLWPSYIKLGFLITALAWLVAVAIVVRPGRLRGNDRTLV